MKVTVYGTDDSTCHQCRFTKRKLSTAGVDYDEVRLDEDPNLLEMIKKEVLDNPYGKLQLPVVRVTLGDGATWTWTGYRPSEVERLVQEIAA